MLSPGTGQVSHALLTRPPLSYLIPSENFLEQLRSTLVNHSSHIAAVVGKHAIHGLGGVGKTRTAIEYAWTYRHEYSAFLFVQADSPEKLRQNL